MNPLPPCPTMSCIHLVTVIESNSMSIYLHFKRMYVADNGNTAVLIESIGKTVGIAWFYRYVRFLSYSLQDYLRSCRGEVPAEFLASELYTLLTMLVLGKLFLRRAADCTV